MFLAGIYATVGTGVRVGVRSVRVGNGSMIRIVPNTIVPTINRITSEPMIDVTMTKSLNIRFRTLSLYHLVIGVTI